MNIRLHHVSKTFTGRRGQSTALREVSLDIREGEFFVLLGPSGCGKSTLLNLMAGLERIDAGRLELGHAVVDGGPGEAFVSPQRRRAAMVFQSYALYPHLSVYENIAFPLRIAGHTRDLDQAVRRAAETLNIANRLQAKPSELSGGQRQRVAIARAIVRKPSVFLLDEPLSNLDAQLRAATRAELKELQKRLGVTTVYVTHDQVRGGAGNGAC